MNAIIGCIIYCLSLIVVSFMFMNDATMYILKIIKDGFYVIINKMIKRSYN